MVLACSLVIVALSLGLAYVSFLVRANPWARQEQMQAYNQVRQCLDALKVAVVSCYAVYSRRGDQRARLLVALQAAAQWDHVRAGCPRSLPGAC